MTRKTLKRRIGILEILPTKKWLRRHIRTDSEDRNGWQMFKKLKNNLKLYNGSEDTKEEFRKIENIVNGKNGSEDTKELRKL